MKLVDEFLFRGPRVGLPELVENKIDVVFSLETGVYDFLNTKERAAFDLFPGDANGRKMKLLQFPLSNIFPPKYHEIVFILWALSQAKHNKLKVYLHCLAGVDRTGFVCAIYRAFCQGWTADQAVAEWKLEGRHWWYFWWEPFLRHMIKIVCRNAEFAHRSGI